MGIFNELPFSSKEYHQLFEGQWNFSASLWRYSATFATGDLPRFEDSPSWIPVKFLEQLEPIATDPFSSAFTTEIFPLCLLEEGENPCIRSFIVQLSAFRRAPVNSASTSPLFYFRSLPDAVQGNSPPQVEELGTKDYYYYYYYFSNLPFPLNFINLKLNWRSNRWNRPTVYVKLKSPSKRWPPNFCRFSSFLIVGW